MFSWTRADFSDGLQFTTLTPKAFSLVWTEKPDFLNYNRQDDSELVGLYITKGHVTIERRI